jgi:hypothetical protein
VFYYLLKWEKRSGLHARSSSAARLAAVCGVVPRCRVYLIFLLFGKIIARVIFFYQRFPIFSDRGLLLTWTWAAPHVLPDRLYIRGSGINLSHAKLHPVSRLQSLASPLPPLVHPVRVRGDQVFGERFCATTDGITSTDDPFPDEDFFSDISGLYIDYMANDAGANANLNANTNATLNTNANPPAAPCAICSYLFQFLLQFLVLVFRINVICLSVLDVICLFILLVCMIRIIHAIILMLYYWLFRVKSYSKMLIYST